MMKKEDLKTIYGKPSDEFHHSVMNVLYHLDDKKAAKHTAGKRIMKTVLVCALITAIGTTTVAAATGFFGLFSRQVGNYGVNITTESSAAAEEMAVHTYEAEILAHYLPTGFVQQGGVGGASYYFNNNIYSDNWYFEATLFEAKDYNKTETYVIKSEEREFKGHKAVISTQKTSESNDHICYIVTEYFEEENIVLRCVFSGEKSNNRYFAPDYNEMIRIMENMEIKMTTETSGQTLPAFEPGAISDYDITEILENEKAQNGVIGETYTVAVSNYDESETNLTIKVTGLTEQHSPEGFEKSDFKNAGNGRSLYDKYFDANGQLVSSYTLTQTDNTGNGIDNLNQTHEKIYYRYFYKVQVELTADNDIDDIYSVLRFDAFGLQEDGSPYRSHEVDYLGSTGGNSLTGLKKGETVTLNAAVIVDAEMKNDARFAILTANDQKKTGTLMLFNAKQ